MSLVTYQINQVVSKTNDTLFSMSGSVVLPSGDTSQRGDEYVGSLRYNTEKSVFEARDVNGWMPVGNFIFNEALDTGIKIDEVNVEEIINVYNSGLISATFTNSGYFVNPFFVGTDITNSSLFVNSVNGYVGVNNISPQVQLDVSGAIHSTELNVDNTITATLFEGRIDGGTY